MTTLSSPRPATLRDVAGEAGVSTATASRVLNGSGRRVADEYRERVVAAAARLGYSANLAARATVRGSSPAVMLLVANITDAYFAEIVEGMTHAADAAGLTVTLNVTNRSPEREATLLRAAVSNRPRGVILAASRMSGPADPVLVSSVRALVEGGAHIVSLGSPIDGIDCRVVGLDNYGGTADLGAHVARIGYRTALVLGAQEGLITGENRADGFMDGFRAHGGKRVTLSRGYIGRASGYEQMQRALASGVEPGTVVFCVSDAMAFGAMTALREAGRRVGDDVAVAGFGALRTGLDIVPSLTTVRTPHEELGRAALEAVTAASWSEQPPLRTQLVVGDSTPPRT